MPYRGVGCIAQDNRYNRSASMATVYFAVAIRDYT